MGPLSHFLSFPDLLDILIHALGLYLAVNALFQSRTPQGATAWFLGLLGFPYVGIPLFIAFGRRRYHDGQKEPKFPIEVSKIVYQKNESIGKFERFLRHTDSEFTANNTIELLVDGKGIYGAMLDDIQKAKEYIILQVYIFRTDDTGKMFAEALSKKSKEGVKVYLLYEKVLIKMSTEVLVTMIDAGVNVGPFKPFSRNKWQLNFRNHRKILVIDGKVGFFGGLNIGDDYLGKYPEIGYWRDTNVRICGPALLPAQRAFARDWLSSQGKEADIQWKIVECEGDANVLVFSSGPQQEKPYCLLHHIAMIDLAIKRLWVANPYIVPPQSLMDALAMAALRGVEVKILVPKKNDNPFIVAVAEIYYERLMEYGVKIFRYQEGFLHQKVMLIDDTLGVVGSANLDFRSMYINFEVTTASSDPRFIQDLEAMLIKDFADSKELRPEDLQKKSTFKRIMERGVNLLAPIL